MTKHRTIHTVVATLLAIATLGTTVAEVPTFSARFEPDSAQVGDRVDYIIDIELDRATEIGVPDFREQLTEEQAEARRSISTYEEYDEDLFELIEEYDIDTIAVDGRQLHLRKRYKLAVMETGHIPMLPAILYFDKNRDEPDTLFSPDTLYLRVARYEQLDTTLFLTVDTATMQLAINRQRAASMLRDEGIHSTKDLPFIFDEVRDYVIYGAIALIILALIVWWIVTIVRRRLEKRRTREPMKPKLPPHVVANKALVELANKKLWQNGKYKPYYTALTSILRVYISERWGVGAMEMTSDEIIAALRDVEMPTESRSNLVEILRTADMVKFAKAEPDADTNETSYTKAYYFVENTKIMAEERIEGKQEITINTNITD